MHSVRKLLFLFVLLTGSALQQQTVTFDEPIDALSIRLPHDNAAVSVMTEDGWHQFVIEKEFDPTLMESDLVMFPTSQTSVTLRGQLDGIDLHPITVSKEPARYSLAATTFYRSPRILSRNDWGANDEFLYRGPDVERSDVQVVQQASSASSQSSNREDDCTLAQKNYPQDFKTTKTVTHDANGERLRWARRYSPEVDLLVVHHTAQKVSGDDRPAIERMRALYEYHANSRSWGDIGYHYIIDEEGGIYEGRSGGDLVVGGHVYCGNVKTVGVAMMGNFELEQPTVQQVQSLQWLLKNLAEKYDIDLNRNVLFKGKNLKPIVRHQDLISTECPGYYVSHTIAQIRNNVVAGNINAGVTFPALAKTNYENRVEQRLTARLEEAGVALSRRFYRAKRQVRTAQRLDNPRLDALQQQLQNSTDLQRKRSATLRQPMRPTRTFYSQQNTAPVEGNIRIRLSYNGTNAEVRGDATVNGNVMRSVRLGKDGDSCVAVDGNTTLGAGIVRIEGSDILTVSSWDTRYNRFRGIIECRVINGELVLINELPLSDYMKGISEQPDTEPREKQKAFAVAARSYAAFYMQPGNEKFAGMPYHGSDTGVSFQNYSGVTAEEDYPKWVQSVLDTAGKVIMKDGGIVKAAYYSSNDGRTRSPSENGWRSFPYEEVFASKPDPWCEGMTLRGHGVGMSGCGAEGQALQGKSYTDILKYYYPGTILSMVD